MERILILIMMVWILVLTFYKKRNERKIKDKTEKEKQDEILKNFYFEIQSNFKILKPWSDELRRYTENKIQSLRYSGLFNQADLEKRAYEDYIRGLQLIFDNEPIRRDILMYVFTNHSYFIGFVNYVRETRVFAESEKSRILDKISLN